MTKKLIFSLLTFTLILGSFLNCSAITRSEATGSYFVFAQEKIEIYFFYSLTCPHCAREKVFLEKLEEKYPEIEIKKLPLSERKNIKFLKEFYENYKVFKVLFP